MGTVTSICCQNERELRNSNIKSKKKDPANQNQSQFNRQSRKNEYYTLSEKYEQANLTDQFSEYCGNSLKSSQALQQQNQEQFTPYSEQKYIEQSDKIVENMRQSCLSSSSEMYSCYSRPQSSGGTTEFQSFSDIDPELEKMAQDYLVKNGINADNFEQECEKSIKNQEEFFQQSQATTTDTENNNNQQMFYSLVYEDNNNSNINIQQAEKEDLKWGNKKTDELKMQRVLDECAKEFKEGGWKLAIKKKGIMNIYKKSQKGSDAIMIRSEIIIPNTKVEEVVKNLYNIGVRKQWDTAKQEMKQLKKIDHETDIFYYILDAGKAIAKRDWIQRRVLKENYPYKGISTIVEYSIDDKDIMSERNGIVRADCVFVGYMIQQSEHCVRVEIVSQNDIKGDIPSFIVNQFADRGTKDWLNQLISVSKDKNFQK